MSRVLIEVYRSLLSVRCHQKYLGLTFYRKRDKQMLTKCIRMLDEFDRGFNVRFSSSPTSRFVSNKFVHEQFSQTANTAASMKRIELEIIELRGLQAQVRVSEEYTVTQSQGLNAPYDGPVRGKIRSAPDPESALDRERLTAFELGKAPSPPLVKFRADLDNFSIDNCPDVIKKSSFYLFFFIFGDEAESDPGCVDRSANSVADMAKYTLDLIAADSYLKGGLYYNTYLPRVHCCSPSCPL
jgi:hypothetical protein